MEELETDAVIVLMFPLFLFVLRLSPSLALSFFSLLSRADENLQREALFYNITRVLQECARWNFVLCLLMRGEFRSRPHSTQLRENYVDGRE